MYKLIIHTQARLLESFFVENNSTHCSLMGKQNCLRVTQYVDFTPLDSIICKHLARCWCAAQVRCLLIWTGRAVMRSMQTWSCYNWFLPRKTKLGLCFGSNYACDEVLCTNVNSGCCHATIIFEVHRCAWK